MAFPIEQTVNFAGQKNNAGNSREMFLKVFSGETLTAFHQKNLALGLTRTRTISSGKSAQFPVLGTTVAKYHTPGQLVQADQLPNVERTVTIDDVALSALFIADIDDAMRHFDVRSVYSMEAGQTLADLIDRNIFRMVAKASFITDATEADNAGLEVPASGQAYTQNIQLANSGDEEDGSALVNAIFKARTQFKKANIPTGDLVVALPPEQYEALVNVTDTSKVTWLNKDVGGVGSVGQGTVPYVAGLRIVESNNIPQTDQTAATGDAEPLADKTVGSGNQAKYRGDFSKVVGLVFHKDAVATTKLMDVSSKWVNEDLRLGSTLLATQAVGHDILRFECAVSILKV